MDRPQFPSKCFVGRIVFRGETTDGLDWQNACPIPAEIELPFDPPMYFCASHFVPMAALLYERSVSSLGAVPGFLGSWVAPLDAAWQVRD